MLAQRILCNGYDVIFHGIVGEKPIIWRVNWKIFEGNDLYRYASLSVTSVQRLAHLIVVWKVSGLNLGWNTSRAD
jgi:hypothetical protein